MKKLMMTKERCINFLTITQHSTIMFILYFIPGTMLGLCGNEYLLFSNSKNSKSNRLRYKNMSSMSLLKILLIRRISFTELSVD